MLCCMNVWNGWIARSGVNNLKADRKRWSISRIQRMHDRTVTKKSRILRAWPFQRPKDIYFEHLLLSEQENSAKGQPSESQWIASYKKHRPWTNPMSKIRAFENLGTWVRYLREPWYTTTQKKCFSYWCIIAKWVVRKISRGKDQGTDQCPEDVNPLTLSKRTLV